MNLKQYYNKTVRIICAVDHQILVGLVIAYFQSIDSPDLQESIVLDSCIEVCESEIEEITIIE